jgi:preprotein translocase subunit SecG
MNAQRLTMTIAGLFILVSLALGHMNGQFDITKFGWTWMLIFVGLNLFQSGLTRFCLMTIILKKVGFK